MPVKTKKQLIEEWIEQLSPSVAFRNDKNESLLYEGPVIYSMGKDFPLARFIETEKDILLTTASGTKTNNSHRNKMMEVLNGSSYNIYHLPDIMMADEDDEINLSYFKCNITNTLNDMIESKNIESTKKFYKKYFLEIKIFSKYLDQFHIKEIKELIFKDIHDLFFQNMNIFHKKLCSMLLIPYKDINKNPNIYEIPEWLYSVTNSNYYINSASSTNIGTILI